MAYKIDEIEGIGAKYAEPLQAAGIKTTDDLLSACGSRKAATTLPRKPDFLPASCSSGPTWPT